MMLRQPAHCRYPGKRRSPIQKCSLLFMKECPASGKKRLCFQCSASMRAELRNYFVYSSWSQIGYVLFNSRLYCRLKYVNFYVA